MSAKPSHKLAVGMTKKRSNKLRELDCPSKLVIKIAPATTANSTTIAGQRILEKSPINQISVVGFETKDASGSVADLGRSLRNDVSSNTMPTTKQ